MSERDQMKLVALLAWTVTVFFIGGFSAIGFMHREAAPHHAGYFDHAAFKWNDEKP